MVSVFNNEGWQDSKFSRFDEKIECDHPEEKREREDTLTGTYYCTRCNKLIYEKH